MAITTNYKEYERLARVMTVEELFNRGMSYVDTPLDEGFAKLLVNFDLKNQGTSLTPRGGITAVPNTDTADFIAAQGASYAVHHVGTTLVQNIEGTDATLHKYALIGRVSIGANGMPYFQFNGACCLIEVNGTYIIASKEDASSVYTPASPVASSVHNTPITPALQNYRGIHASIEGNTYIMGGSTIDDINMFMRLNLKFTSANTIRVLFGVIGTPNVPASQAINTGYNMMAGNPYNFPNAQNATGGLVLNGIIPKTEDGTIKLTADVGEPLIYHLNYTYPASHAGAQYLAQWELADAMSSSTPFVLQQVRKSPAYTPGDAITYALSPPYKQFTMVVKIYDKATVDAHTYVSDEDDLNALAPLKVMTVSSYYTTAGASDKAANLTPQVYDLRNCKGMCTWQQRLVLWGVPKATSTLFVSQPNLPEYVPYPNNIEIFPEDIMRCIPYLTNLLVFTSTKLYQLSLANDGRNTYYVVKCVQENLNMTITDAHTIQVIKNMVYFKSGNYFYMVVPNSKVGAGELQIAPISRPIEPLLDDFEKSVEEIINSVYNLTEVYDLKEASDSYSLVFHGFTTYLDGSTLRNVYKVKLTVIKSDVLVDTRYFSFVLNYDTQLRAWTTHLYESTLHDLVLFENSATGNSVYLMPYTVAASGAAGDIKYRLVVFDSNSSADTAWLDDTNTKQRKFFNHQLIDTGYRAHFTAFKKRFREIQFTINNTQQSTLQFYTGFTLDDDVRKDLFTHTVQHATDPESPDYGILYVERSLIDPINIAGAITTVDTGWTLDFSRFPTITISKIRYRVSGKGYFGGMKILSKNEKPYELLSIHWVYRKMNAR